MKYFLLGLFFSFHLNLVAKAYEKADTFIVKIHNDRVRVVSPTGYDPKMAIIIQNKTLTPIIGKIVKNQGEILHFLKIGPSKSRSYPLTINKGDRAYFIPQSPPFQKIELVLGRKVYEIPPKETK